MWYILLDHWVIGKKFLERFWSQSPFFRHMKSLLFFVSASFVYFLFFKCKKTPEAWMIQWSLKREGMQRTFPSWALWIICLHCNAITKLNFYCVGATKLDLRLPGFVHSFKMQWSLHCNYIYVYIRSWHSFNDEAYGHKCQSAVLASWHWN